ncbi:hypothetical protein CHCC15337_0500 [Bacillus paralicheniformis]|nr:hypothetical protein CHCC5021_1527 [Bacillus paralicheniformis]TWL05499.1 hypothetical protein CHCC19468_4397 [Bacillus paralicheniformis]TWL11677.1 hypothetical protein CHCC19467_3767 [Bacillus paralicheniformis]TWL38444.1 hypothetical protein CHCC15337_0500 [Bacillus paralicheniformis]TWL48842.1 hypothetical protein CHCC15332_1705 [Bacillus paralicheniformis]
MQKEPDEILVPSGSHINLVQFMVYDGAFYDIKWGKKR